MERCFKNLEQCSFYPIEEKTNKAFVLMPFDKTFNEIYQVGIKAGLEEIGWKCDRSDEREDTPDVICTICKSIQEASLLIVDVTGKKPNVFLELGLSFGLEKNILLITQDYGDLPFNLRTFRAKEYNSKNLKALQKNIQESIVKLRPVARISEEAIVFQENCEIYGGRFKNYKKPMMRILIGSKNSRERWLEASDENRIMLNCTPYFLAIDNVIARENYYSFKSYYDDYFLRIFPDGFIVSHFACVEWAKEKDCAYIHELIYGIAGMFIFANRIMKHKKLTHPQRIIIEIYIPKALPVKIDPSIGYGSWTYTFEETPVIIPSVRERALDFNPSNDWGSLLGTICTIYRKICSHLGIQKIEDKTIRTNLLKLLQNMRELRTTYTPSGIPSVFDELASHLKG